MLDEELIIDVHNITSLCAGLIAVNQKTNVVNLVHYTTEGFFKETREFYFPSFHASITSSCTTYLTLRALRDVTISEVMQHHPLTCYAAQYIGDHARQTPEDALEPAVLETIYRLLSHPEKRKLFLRLLDRLDLVRSDFYSSRSGFYSLRSSFLASDFGSVANAQMNKKPLEDAFQSDSERALNRSEDIPIAALPEESLSLEEDLAARGETLSTCSTITGATSHQITQSENSVSQLNESSMWENAGKSNQILDVTAFQLAASMGLVKVASMLLKVISDIDAVDEAGKPAVTVAIEHGYERAVEFLINSDAYVDLRHVHGREILLLVAERSWHSLGARIAANTQSEMQHDHIGLQEQQTLLFLAAYLGDVDEVQRLIQLVDIDQESQSWDLDDPGTC